MSAANMLFEVAAATMIIEAALGDFFLKITPTAAGPMRREAELPRL